LHGGADYQRLGRLHWRFSKRSFDLWPDFMADAWRTSLDNELYQDARGALLKALVD